MIERYEVQKYDMYEKKWKLDTRRKLLNQASNDFNGFIKANKHLPLFSGYRIIDLQEKKVIKEWFDLDKKMI